MQIVRIIEDQQGYLSTRSVGALLDMHPRTIRRLAEEGKFPQPFVLNGRTFRWKKSEICYWIETHPRGITFEDDD